MSLGITNRAFTSTLYIQRLQHFSRSTLLNLYEHFAHALVSFCLPPRQQSLRVTKRAINTQEHLIITLLKPTPVLTADGTLGLFSMNLREVFENFAIIGLYSYCRSIKHFASVVEAGLRAFVKSSNNRHLPA